MGNGEIQIAIKVKVTRRQPTSFVRRIQIVASL